MAGDRLTSQGNVNLDWTRNPPPPTLTPYQELIRDLDWSQTSLGPMQTWQQELRQTVLFMIADVAPAILYWGEHHTIIYNEAYISLVGKQHPRLLGLNASDAFPEFWPYFDNIIAEQRLSGQCRAVEAEMLLMERHGFLEETYFDWKLTPVIGAHGTMLGAYGVPTELTNDIINSRRIACFHSLTQLTNNTSSIEQLWQNTMTGLSQNEKDIPLAMLYSLDPASFEANSTVHATPRCNLEAVLGVSEDHPGIKKQLDMERDLDGLAPIILKALQQASVYSISISENNLEHFFDNVKWRGFGIPVRDLVFLPLEGNGSIAAILILGLNPRLRFTDRYCDFVQVIGNILSPQVSKLQLAEQVESRDQIARNAVSGFQKSEMNFSRFAQRAPVGLGLTTKEGKVIYANESWYDFCGLTSDKQETSSWIETIHEDDLSLVNEWWHKVIDLKQSGTFQVRSKTPFANGDMELPHRTGIVAIYPDLDDNDNVATVMGLVLDISELKWTEKQLRLRQKEIEDSEKKYREFAEHAPIGVIRTDKEGYAIFANDAWRSFYNFDQDHEFTEPEPWLSSLNQEDVPLARQFFRDICERKKATTVEVRLQRPRTNLGAHRSSPAEFWLLSTGFADLNPDGSIASINFWVTDISDQKAAERVLTDKMEEAIRLRNTQERFVDMISHEIRNPLSAILHCGEEIVEAMKSNLAVMDNQLDHQTHISTVQLSPKEHVSNALDAANTIMYCVQHQKQIVDDVLTLSKLDADLLVVSPVPVQPTELVRSALKIFEPELKASSVELAFKIGSSLQELGVEWIMLDPNRFLQIIINLVTNAIKFTKSSETRRITISVEARKDKPPPHYQGVQYVPRREAESGPEDKIRENGSHQGASEELFLCFSVADTGKGLTESERDILFERFTQASPKTHIEYGGSGLGLFISRQITEMLGGEIGVGSEPGQGAVFAFYVRTRRVIPPRRLSLEPEPMEIYTKQLVSPIPSTWVTGHNEPAEPSNLTPDRNPLRPPEEPAANVKRRVLVVEDNLVNQKVLCKQLRNRGFLVDAANHGREALDALTKAQSDKATPFDVILCDIEMPIMNGIECVSEIRRLEKTGTFSGHIPIIGVTANVRSKQVNAAIEVGMDGVTTKPYRIDDLIAHIDRVFAEVQLSPKH